MATTATEFRTIDAAAALAIRRNGGTIADPNPVLSFKLSTVSFPEGTRQANSRFHFGVETDYWQLPDGTILFHPQRHGKYNYCTDLQVVGHDERSIVTIQKAQGYFK